MLADFDEREKALDPSRSFIVEAPAGSGKTGLLVQRFLRLLGVVERPESIVAMTFMRKAAAEMKGRIYESLLAARDGLPVENDFDQKTRDLAIGALAQDRKSLGTCSSIRDGCRFRLSIPSAACWRVRCRSSRNLAAKAK